MAAALDSIDRKAIHSCFTAGYGFTSCRALHASPRLLPESFRHSSCGNQHFPVLCWCCLQPLGVATWRM